MATLRQKKLARAIIDNIQSKDTKTAGESLENTGYSKATAESISGEIIGSKGVQEELIALGFTEYNAKSVVASIMNSEACEPNARLKAADMTFKVHGSYAPEKSINLNATATYNLTPDQIEKINQIALDENE